MSKATLRIKGLVSLMNDVRARLSVGIPPEHADDFRAMVEDSVRQRDVLNDELQMMTCLSLAVINNRRAYASQKWK